MARVVAGVSSSAAAVPPLVRAAILAAELPKLLLLLLLADLWTIALRMVPAAVVPKADRLSLRAKLGCTFTAGSCGL